MVRHTAGAIEWNLECGSVSFFFLLSPSFLIAKQADETERAVKQIEVAEHIMETSLWQ